MEDLIRRATVQRGHDPRSFVLWGFGGASGAHAGLFGRGIGVREVVFPLNNTASVWSAYGLALLRADADVPGQRLPAHRRSTSTGCRRRSPTSKRGRSPTPRDHDMGDIELVRRADMKYPLQVYEVETELPARRGRRGVRRGTAREVPSHLRRSLRPGLGICGGRRDDQRGAGHGARCRAAAADRQSRTPVGGRPPSTTSGRCTGASSAARTATPVYWGPQLAPWTRLRGPTIVEYPHTTIAVRPGKRCTSTTSATSCSLLEDQS